MSVTINGYECEVYFGQYGNGNIAIQLIGKTGTDYEHEAIATASVNGEIELPNHIVGIKTWSENKGMVQALVDGGVIEPKLIGGEPTGFVAIEHYELTKASLDEISKLKEEAI